jgi:hypothetical protein
MLSAAPASWLRVQNLAFTDNQVSAIYDWDSVALVPEPALVGSASVMHPIDGRLERPDPLPTLAPHRHDPFEGRDFCEDFFLSTS